MSKDDVLQGVLAAALKIDCGLGGTPFHPALLNEVLHIGTPDAIGPSALPEAVVGQLPRQTHAVEGGWRDVEVHCRLLDRQVFGRLVAL
jgi:hypothetical protein